MSYKQALVATIAATLFLSGCASQKLQLIPINPEIMENAVRMDEKEARNLLDKFVSGRSEGRNYFYRYTEERDLMPMDLKYRTVEVRGEVKNDRIVLHFVRLGKRYKTYTDTPHPYSPGVVWRRTVSGYSPEHEFDSIEYAFVDFDRIYVLREKNEITQLHFYTKDNAFIWKSFERESGAHNENKYQESLIAAFLKLCPNITNPLVSRAKTKR